jgi:hypothetical protein
VQNIKLLMIFDEEGDVVFAYSGDNTVSKKSLDPSLMRTLTEEMSIVSHAVGSHYEFVGALKFSEPGEIEEEYVFGFVKMWLYKAYIDQEVKQWMRDLFLLFILIMSKR